VTDRTPIQSPPVRRPDLVQPHTVVDLRNGPEEDVIRRLMETVHGCNLNDPPRLTGGTVELRGSR
jgi:cyanobactin biosynthesis protein (PatB/AcyB/McaB family)